MQFQDELAGGIVLIRPALRSPNYVAGSAGWSIDVDGSAEFNDITIRSGTVISGESLFYDPSPGLGNLFLSIAAAAGTDTYGNTFQKGLTLYSTNGTINLDDTTAVWDHTGGSRIEIGVGGAQALQELTPRDLTGSTWSSGSFGTNIANVYDGNVNAPSIFLESPHETSGVAKSSIQLFGNSDTATTSSLIRHVAGDHQFVTGDVQLSGGQITEYDADNFDTWTPTISGGGAATFTTRNGFWQRIGKMVFVRVYVVVNVAGSGAANVTFDLPVTPYRSGGRQNIAGCARDGGVVAGPCGALVFAGGAGATIDRIVNSAGTDVTGALLTAGSIWTFEGWIREA